MNVICFDKIIKPFLMNPLPQNIFKQKQLKFERVQNAYQEKWELLRKQLTIAGVKENFELLIIVFKHESILNVWLKAKSQSRYKHFKTYNFSAVSGNLGPKIKEGDLQIPEGFYHIQAFNPQSKYHLSLGLNYPNKVDEWRSGKNKPGSEIYLHGGNETQGCMPLTDDKIKEVYILAIEAKNNGQTQIPVYIFPFKMNEDNMEKLTTEHPQNQFFWENLKQGYDYFEKHGALPKIDECEGKYKLNIIAVR